MDKVVKTGLKEAASTFIPGAGTVIDVLEKSRRQKMILRM